MLKAGDVLDLGPLQMVIRVKEATAEVLGVEIEVGPNSGGTPLHTHPNAVESYEVLEGHFDAYLDGEWKSYGVGEKVVVGRGVPHTFRNSSPAKVRVYNTHAPALEMGGYFEGLQQIANNPAVRNGKMNLQAIMLLSLLMTKFKNEITPVAPPPPVTNMMAFLGRLAGYKV